MTTNTETVRVYYNLRKKCYSVQHKTPKGWRLSFHIKHLRLKNVTFSVSQKGRDRVIREKQKNVHAYVTGDIVNQCTYDDGLKVTYNPYVNNSFIVAETLEPVYQAHDVSLTPHGVFVNK